MKKKIKICFLFDKKNDWFKKFFNIRSLKSYKNYQLKKEYDFRKVKKQDIVIIINYTKILSKSFLSKNNLNLVIHASNLPKDRGFAPVAYQVLKKRKKIYMCLIEAAEKVDTGKIILKNYFNLDGTELYDEIREKTAKAMIQLIRVFLKKYPNLKSRKQFGKPTFNRRRNSSDSLLNINKSIKSQFDLIRICDNENFPLFFNLRKKRYILKVYKWK